MKEESYGYLHHCSATNRQILSRQHNNSLAQPTSYRYIADGLILANSLLKSLRGVWKVVVV